MNWRNPCCRRRLWQCASTEPMLGKVPGKIGATHGVRRMGFVPQPILRVPQPRRLEHKKGLPNGKPFRFQLCVGARETPSSCSRTVRHECRPCRANNPEGVIRRVPAGLRRITANAVMRPTGGSARGVSRMNPLPNAPSPAYGTGNRTTPEYLRIQGWFCSRASSLLQGLL